MDEKSNLLNRIKSKFILQKIISMAFSDIKSVLELTKYNKSLNNKLGINIKNYYQYNSIIKITKNFLSNDMFFCQLLYEAIIILLFLIYIIIFYVKGTFNNDNLKKEYSAEMKRFVDFMNNYILFAYLGFIVISFLLKILFLFRKIFLKGNIKRIYTLLIFIVNLAYFIVLFIKCICTIKIIDENLLKSQLIRDSNSIWFLYLDLCTIIFTIINIFFQFALIIICFQKRGDDIKELFLIQINRININDFKLPSNLDNLNEKAKNEFIFNKNNMKKYEYKLNENQIDLITKINHIRQQNNVPKLKYEEKEKLPDFIINKKTELIFYKKESIYKLSKNFYVFKYPKNEFKNNLNDKDIINILTIDFLDRINIIEQDYIEFVSIYHNIYINEINNSNNNINEPHIYINIRSPEINFDNSKDKINNKSEKREVRNIRIHKKAF